MTLRKRLAPHDSGELRRREGPLADFDRTQARLSTEYGPMPRALRSQEYTLSSTKKINHFVIQHCLSEPGGVPVEQVFST